MHSESIAFGDGREVGEVRLLNYIRSGDIMTTRVKRLAQASLLFALSFACIPSASSQMASPIELSVNVGHRDGIMVSAISPDERFLVTASGFDGTVRIWDFVSGRLIRTVSNIIFPTALRFGRDPYIFALGSNAGEISLFDIRTALPVRTFKAHNNNFGSLDFSPDGRTLVSGGWTGDIRIWNVADGKQLPGPTGNFGWIQDVRFISDNKFVSASDDRKVRFWDLLNSREPIWTIDLDATKIAISRAGNLFAATSKDGSARIFNIQNQQMLWQTTREGTISYLEFSSDDKSLFAGGNAGIVEWNAVNGEVVAEGNVSVGPPKNIPLVSPSGKRFFTLKGGDIFEIDRAFHRWHRRFPIIDVPASGDQRSLDNIYSRFILSEFGAAAAPIDVEALGKKLSEKLGNQLRVTSVSRDGHTVSALSFPSNEVTVWNVDSGGEQLLQRQSIFDQRRSLEDFAMSQNGRAAAGALRNRAGVALWNIADNSVISLPAFTASSGKIAFAGDGHLLAVTSVADNFINLFETKTGSLKKRFPIVGNPFGFIFRLGVSADGTLVAVGSKINQVWNESGTLVSTLQASAWTPLGFEFSKEKRLVLSRNPVAQIWEVATGRLLVSNINFSNGEWISISPEGFFDASSPKAAQNLNVVRGLEVSSIDQVYNALYRPDLVREKLAGDPDGKVKAAAAKLDLDKVMASGSAPKVLIMTPTAGTSSATDEVSVEATVSDQGGGIGKVEWRVNGVTLGVETRGLERIGAAASAGRSLTVKRSLALERGENRIEVLAYNNKDLIASEPASVTVTWDGEKTATPPKLFVMAVGVNDYYDSRLRLSYAVPDANAIAEGFRKAGTGLYAAVDVTTVLDTDVTIANLDKVFTELGKKAQPRDVFVFFLAGHGKTKNGRYYFLPRDFRYEDEDSIEKSGMDQDKFQAWFARIPARKSILLYDTCESGSLTGTKARGSDIDERLGALNRMTRATGRTFLTATTDDAPALEGYRGHGVFTYALLDALEHADVNKNGLIEVSELADYIDQKVPDYSFDAFKLRQIPQRNIVGNNFSLTNKIAILTGTGTFPAKATAASVGGAPSSDVVIPAKPTHVAITPVDVFERLAGQGAKLQQLPAGTLLSLIKIEQGWMLVAKDGKSVGYVAEDRLMRVQ
jgi:WD40 repeat protein